MVKFRFFLHALIGAPVLFFISCFFLGGIEKAGTIVMLAVVCTAGVSLIVLLPACALAGWIVASVYRSVWPDKSAGAGGEGSRGGTAGVRPPPLPSRECLAIAAYLRQAAAAHVRESQAVEALMAEGWTREKIREAQEFVWRIPAG